MSHCNGCSRFGGKRLSLKSRNLRATLLQKSYAYLRGCYGLKSRAYFVKGLHFESSQVKTRKGWSFASWNSSNLARINSQSIDSILLLFWSSSKSDINWKAAHMLVSAVASWLINLLFIWKRKEDTFYCTLSRSFHANYRRKSFFKLGSGCVPRNTIENWVQKRVEKYNCTSCWRLLLWFDVQLLRCSPSGSIWKGEERGWIN